MKGKKYGKEARAENFLWERVMKRIPAGWYNGALSMPIKLRQRDIADRAEVQESQMPWEVGDQSGKYHFGGIGLFPLLGELSEWNLGKQTFPSFYMKKLRLRE